MSTCSNLATKEELQELRNLIDSKLDKSEREPIIQTSISSAVPLAVTGAIAALFPEIRSISGVASNALAKAARNAGTITRNAGKIARNAAGVASNLANIVNLLASLGALALATKHEYVDLPDVRSKIKANARNIDLNFKIILENKLRLNYQQQQIDNQARQIAQNQKAIFINAGLIAENRQTAAINRRRIEINEVAINQNALEIIRIEKAYKQDIQQTETILRNEYISAIDSVRNSFQTQLDQARRDFDSKLNILETNFQISQAIQNRELQASNAVVSGLKNNISGIRSDVQNALQGKANTSDLVRIGTRVATVQSTANTALTNSRIARRSGGISLKDKQTLADLETKTNNIEKTIAQGNVGVNEQQITKIREGVKTDVQAVLAGAGLLTVPALLSQTNAKVPTQAQLVQATQTGICNSSSSGGCLNTKLKNPLSGKLDDLLTAFNTTANAGNVAINVDILNRVTNIQNVVNSTTNGLAAINNFMRQAWSNTKLDKVLNVLNTVLALHNALMLSRNLGQTLGDVATSALQFLNIKDADNNTIDVNEFIGNTVTTWITNLVGAQTYANIQTTWISLNRIMVAAQGMVSAVQGVKNALLESIETVGGWTAKIGNSMVIQGLLEERSFPWMNENINFRNPFSKFMQKIEVTEEILGQVNSLVSSGIEAQENFNELINNSSELTTSSQKLAENLAQFDLDKQATETTETTNSASPDINNSDLIKSETEE